MIRWLPKLSWRYSRRRLAVELGVLVAVGVGGWLVLRRQQVNIVFPGHVTQGEPNAVVTAPPGSKLITLITDRGDRVAALFGSALPSDGQPEPNADACPTVLFFYGNGLCLNQSLDLFHLFRTLGANVLIPDYVGYGMSDGVPSETGCQATADAAYAYLRAQHIPPERLVISGWSLGSAVASDLASREPAAGLMIFGAFTSLDDMARRIIPYFPVSWLLKYHFNSRAKIAQVKTPILIVHGTADPLVPVSMSGQLEAVAGGPVTCVLIDGAGHDDLFIVGKNAISKAIRAFLRR